MEGADANGGANLSASAKPSLRNFISSVSSAAVKAVNNVVLCIGINTSSSVMGVDSLLPPFSTAHNMFGSNSDAIKNLPNNVIMKGCSPKSIPTRSFR